MGRVLHYYRPEKLEEALERMERMRLRPLAGGTDFLVSLREDQDYLKEFSGIVDLARLKSLTTITLKEEGVEIGAMVTHSQLLSQSLILKHFPALVRAASLIGSTQIRNRGTIGGNVCNTAPSADTLGPLMVYEAQLFLASRSNKRRLLVRDFVTAPYENKCRGDELLTHFLLPLPLEGSLSSFVKIGRRRAQAKARLSLSYQARIEDGFIKEIRLVPGAVTPVPMPFTKVEREMIGKRPSDLPVEELGEMATEEMIKITGERWSTPYKGRVLPTLIARVLHELKEEVE